MLTIAPSVPPHSPITATLIEKQSRFIAHLCPYSEFDDLLVRLRTEHPKARHFVSAHRFFNEFEQVVEGSSDDGEPKGTSGKPTLSVLQGHELINVAIVTVRYFGGTKLGTGGLVRAYSDVANMVIETAELIPYRREYLETIAMSYSDMGRVEYAVEQAGLAVDDRRFEAAQVVFQLRGEREQLDRLIAGLDRLCTRL